MTGTVYICRARDDGAEVEIEVHYSVSGRHIPATRMDPEEWPQIEIVAAFELTNQVREITLTDAEKNIAIERAWEDDHV